ADEIEAELLVERRVYRVGRADDEQRVAVRRRVHHRFGGDVAAGAGTILDDALLTETLGQPLTDQARGDVGGTAGGKSDDETDGPAWIALRLRKPGDGQRRRRSGQLEKSATYRMQGVPHLKHCR